MDNSIDLKYDVSLEELLNMRVCIYRNLHKNKWSVKCLQGKNYGRVVAHLSNCSMIVEKFNVNKNIQSWVRVNKVKKVHAYVIGKIVNFDKFNIEKLDEIYYNPYLTDKFIIKSSLVEVDTLLNNENLYFDKSMKIFKYLNT